MSKSQAVEIAEKFSTALSVHAAYISERSEYARALVEMHIDMSLNDGQPSSKRLPAQPVDNAKVREFVYVAQDAAVRRLWQRHRIVYDIDPDLWAELGDIEPSTQIPHGLFTALPHPDPFVALPVPLVLPIDDQFQQRIRGFYVTGRGFTLGPTQISTHSPSASGHVGLLIGGEVEYRDSGKPYMIDSSMQDFVWNRVTLERDLDTVGEMIDSIQQRYDVSPIAAGHQHLPETISACVAALIYLCAKNAELRPLPASVGKRRNKGSSVKPVKVIQVGYLIGPALRAWRRSEARTAGQPTGQRKRPHIRRSHFHTYKVGPGRLVSEVKFLSPIAVNATTSDAAKSTAIGVK